MKSKFSISLHLKGNNNTRRNRKLPSLTKNKYIMITIIHKWEKFIKEALPYHPNFQDTNYMWQLHSGRQSLKKQYFKIAKHVNIG